jgi:hypothetical protein
MTVTLSQQQNINVVTSVVLVNHADLSEPWLAVSVPQ